MRAFQPFVFLMVLFLFAACGGGGGGGDGGQVGAGLPEFEVGIVSTPELDGAIVKRGGQYIGTGGTHPALGDLHHTLGDQVYRTVFSFDLAFVPAGARIVSAELSVYQTAISNEPYRLFDVVVVDHIDMGDVFDPRAFDQLDLGPVLDAEGAPAVLSDNRGLSRRAISVRDAVQADVDAGRTRSQFRVRGAADTPNTNGVADLAHFGDSTDLPSVQPRLEIVYVLP